MSDEWKSYAYGEGRTNRGILARFTCRTQEDVKLVRDLPAEKVGNIGPTESHQSNIAHGGMGRYSRYRIKQHEYAGGGPGFVEALEVYDSPNGQHGIVLHEYVCYHGSWFSEWETVENALKAFNTSTAWASGNGAEAMKKLPGFKRLVDCGPLTPWFYAVGNEDLIGDFAVPFGLEDDPVFRLGRRFVVWNRAGFPGLKTCLGTRYLVKEEDRMYGGGKRKTRHRIVYWQDGTCWDESIPGDKGNPPQEMPFEERWIVQALEEFQRLLGGAVERFEIPFLDGSKFVGRIQKKTRTESAAGNYFVAVSFADRTRKEGWIMDFQPTPECPTLAAYIEKKAGKAIACLKVTQKQPERGGKKWAGVFHARNLKETLEPPRSE